MKSRIVISIIISVLFHTNVFAKTNEADVTVITFGKSREEMHLILGTPTYCLDNGIKDEYELENGNRAVIFYNRYGYSERGFIIEEV